MINIKKISTILLLISIFLWRCGSSTDKSFLNVDNDSLKIEEPIEIDNKSYEKLNLNLFISQLDSLVPLITNSRNQFRVLPHDSLFNIKDSLFYLPKSSISTATYIKRYDITNGNNLFQLIVIEAKFPHDSIAESIFEEIRNDAKGDASVDGMPCLTYSNDFVIKSNTKIFWLNGGCSYAYYNFNKISYLFYKDISGSILDSIKCECGGAYIE